LYVEAQGDDAGELGPQDAPPPPAPRAVDSESTLEWPPTRLGPWVAWFLAVASVVLGASFLLWAERVYSRAQGISPWLGTAVASVLAAALFLTVMLVIREYAILGRMRKLSALRAKTAALLAGETIQADPTEELIALYKGRRDLSWATTAFWEEVQRHSIEATDVTSRIMHFEAAVLSRLDERAHRHIEAAARHVATATILMPSALLDALAAIVINLRMIRRIAAIYGGRSSFLGSLRLARRVITHAMMAGLIEIGGDLVAPIFGGGLAAAASRRLGEGAINGSMTTRIGVVAADLCRPVPYIATAPPTVQALVLGALKGVTVGRAQSGDQ
jgi:putative membrane protein